VTTALCSAMADIKRSKAGLVPPHLRDGHYSGSAGWANAHGDRYSHDDRMGLFRTQVYKST